MGSRLAQFAEKVREGSGVLSLDYQDWLNIHNLKDTEQRAVGFGFVYLGMVRLIPFGASDLYFAANYRDSFSASYNRNLWSDDYFRIIANSLSIDGADALHGALITYKEVGLGPTLKSAIEFGLVHRYNLTVQANVYTTTPQISELPHSSLTKDVREWLNSLQTYEEARPSLIETRRYSLAREQEIKKLREELAKEEAQLKLTRDALAYMDSLANHPDNGTW